MRTDAQADLSLRWADPHFDGFAMSRLISTKPQQRSVINYWRRGFNRFLLLDFCCSSVSLINLKVLG